MIKLDLEKLAELINKFGFAIIMGGVFIWNSIDTNSRMHDLQQQYLNSQKEDRAAYIELNTKMINTINTLNTNIELMGIQIKTTNDRLKELEREVRTRPVTQTTVVGNENNMTKK